MCAMTAQAGSGLSTYETVASTHRLKQQQEDSAEGVKAALDFKLQSLNQTYVKISIFL